MVMASLVRRGFEITSPVAGSTPTRWVMLSLITTWTRRSWTAQSVMMLRKIIVIRSAERPRGGTVGGTSGQTATRSGIQLNQRIAIQRASEIVSRAASPYPTMRKKRIAAMRRRVMWSWDGRRTASRIDMIGNSCDTQPYLTRPYHPVAGVIAVRAHDSARPWSPSTLSWVTRDGGIEGSQQWS